MNPTRWKINWSAVVQLGLGVAAGLVAAVGTLAVAVTSFSLSFDAITAVAKAAHVRGSIAWMMPVTVDGAMLVATVAAVVMSRIGAGKRVFYPWAVVVVGALISILCNAAHATGKVGPHGAIDLNLNSASRMAISAIPAIMLALAVHLLTELLDAFQELAGPPRTRAGDRPADAPLVHAEAGAPAAPGAGPAAGAARLTTGGSDPLAVHLTGDRARLPSAAAGAPALPAPSAPPSAAPSAALSEGSGAPAPAAPKPRTAASRKKPARKPARPRRTGADLSDVRFLKGKNLVARIARDFADGDVSARAIMRMYPPMGTPTATRIYKDWQEATASAPAPAAPSAGGSAGGEAAQ